MPAAQIVALVVAAALGFVSAICFAAALVVDRSWLRAAEKTEVPR